MDLLTTETCAFAPPVSDKSVLPAFGSTLIQTSGDAASSARKKRIIVRRVMVLPLLCKWVYREGLQVIPCGHSHNLARDCCRSKKRNNEWEDGETKALS